jgi:hypothetical protein
MDDPHQGMRRVRDFPNLWFGKSARSDHGVDSVVVCSYQIDEAEEHRDAQQANLVTTRRPQAQLAHDVDVPGPSGAHLITVPSFP